MDKPFFIGQRSLQIVARQVKQKLIGFMLDAGFQGLPQECHLVIDRGEIAGRVTSIAFSPTLRRYIGWHTSNQNWQQPLRNSPIGRFVCDCNGKSNPFYDPDNTRQRELVITREEVAV